MKNFIISIAVFLFSIAFYQFVIAFNWGADWTRAGNKMINIGLVTMFYMNYKFFYRKMGFDEDEIISQNAIALAIKDGAYVLAMAWAAGSV